MLVLLFVSNCKEEDENKPGGGNDGAIPVGIARIAGRAVDGAGNGLGDVQLRVAYADLPARPFGDPLVNAAAIFYTNQTLVTQCDGTVPLSDGISVRVFWDQNNNGVADASDPPPPLCDDPPNCETGPARTVNFNEFTINGQSVEFGAGRFYGETAFSTVGDVQDPSAYFLRIYCNDGAILYESDVETIPEGPSEIEFTFNCFPCDDPPIVPEWSLSQAFPNPTSRTATIYYGLREATVARLLLQRVGASSVDTLIESVEASGGHTYVLDFGTRANGLYDYRISAGAYSNTRQLLLNAGDPTALRAQAALTTSDGTGNYTLDIAAGTLVDLRDSTGFSQGLVPLNQVRINASKPGFFDVDSTVAIQSQDSLFIALELRPR
jgi:hypothetical protein